jgi:putative peptidoglycan lipid II flippase
VLAPAFYALNNARTPMIVSLVSIAINYLAASTMIRIAGLGHAGLALSTSIVAIFNFLALLWAMRGRIGGIHGRDLLTSLIKVTAASLLMGAVCYGSSHMIRESLGLGRWARLADLGLSIPLGLAVFYVSARVLGVAELEMVPRLRRKDRLI